MNSSTKASSVVSVGLAITLVAGGLGSTKFYTFYVAILLVGIGISQIDGCERCCRLYPARAAADSIK